MLGKLQIDWNSKDFEMSHDPVVSGSHDPVLSGSSVKAFNKELLKCFDQIFPNNKEEAGRALANSLSGIAMMQADWGRLDSDIVTILSTAIENRYHYHYLSSSLLLSLLLLLALILLVLMSLLVYYGRWVEWVPTSINSPNPFKK
jgi:hypothetical protein